MADALFVASFTIEVVIAILTAIGNGLVLFVILYFRHLRTVTNFLIASLAAADFLVGSVGIPCVLVTNFGLPHTFYGCLMMNCIIIILTQVSIFSLLSVAVERYVAIRHPFFYQKHFTTKVVLAINLINWTLGLLVGLVPFLWNLGWNDQNICGFIFVIDFNYRVYFNFFGFILTPLLIMLAIYIYIFRVVLIQGRKINSLQVSQDPSSNNQQQKFRQEAKAAKKFALVIGLFALSWIPLETMNAVSLLFHQTCIPCVYFAIWLSHANSVFNPFIYAYGNTAMKNALRKVLRCKSGSVDNVDGATLSTVA